MLTSICTYKYMCGVLGIYIYTCCYFLELNFAAFRSVICSNIIAVVIVMATCVTYIYKNSNNNNITLTYRHRFQIFIGDTFPNSRNIDWRLCIWWLRRFSSREMWRQQVIHTHLYAYVLIVHHMCACIGTTPPTMHTWNVVVVVSNLNTNCSRQFSVRQWNTRRHKCNNKQVGTHIYTHAKLKCTCEKITAHILATN